MRKIKNMRVLLAVSCLLLLGGTAAAILYSNTLTGDIVLVSQYPLGLSWQGAGPWTDMAFCDVTYTDNLIVANQGDEAMGLSIIMEVVVPTGAVMEDLYITLGGTVPTFVDRGTHFEFYLVTSITAGQTKNMPFEIALLLGAPEGTYSVTIWVDRTS